MQTLNRFVGGRQEVGHIDLLDTISYFEVPEKDAKKVMIQLTGIRYKGRQVRCNDSEDKGAAPGNNAKKGQPKRQKSSVQPPRPSKKDDWRDMMEDGWAMRKPRKKKK
jgi:ATP-dependent RNA helicase DeaD